MQWYIRPKALCSIKEGPQVLILDRASCLFVCFYLCFFNSGVRGIWKPNPSFHQIRFIHSYHEEVRKYHQWQHQIDYKNITTGNTTDSTCCSSLCHKCVFEPSASDSKIIAQLKRHSGSFFSFVTNKACKITWGDVCYVRVSVRWYYRIWKRSWDKTGCSVLSWCRQKQDQQRKTSKIWQHP